MIEFAHVVMWLLGKRLGKQADEEARRSERILHPLKSGQELELAPADEDCIMGVAESVIFGHVSRPETAQVIDFAFYGPTEWGMAVYAEVESTNIVGARATNHFVVS